MKRKNKRLLYEAIQFGIDDRLVNFLDNLKAIHKETWRSYMKESSYYLQRYEHNQAIRSFERKLAEPIVKQHIPKAIKSTKMRKR